MANLLRCGRAWRILATTLVAAMAIGAVALASRLNGTPARQARATAGPTAGDFVISNSRAGEAIFSVDDLRPGSPASGQTTIANAGDLHGVVTLSKTDELDQPGPGGGRLGDIADVLVTDVTRPQAPATVFAGNLAAMPSVSLGTFAPGEAHTYDFRVSMPAHAPGGAEPPDINAYQASSLQIGYVWTGTSVDSPDTPAPPVDAPAPPANAPPTPADPPPTLAGTKPPAPAAPLPPSTGASPSPSDPPTDAASSGSEAPVAGSIRGLVGKSPEGRRDRGPEGTPSGRDDHSAEQAEAGRSKLSEMLDAVKRGAILVGERGAFPAILLLLLIAFFYVQHWLYRRDPKLALAPVEPEPTRTFS